MQTRIALRLEKGEKIVRAQSAISTARKKIEQKQMTGSVTKRKIKLLDMVKVGVEQDQKSIAGSDIIGVETDRE